MSEKKENAKKSIKSRVVLFMFILIPLILLFSVMNIVGSYYMKRDIYSYYGSFIDYYINEVDSAISKIDQKLGLLILQESDIDRTTESYIQKVPNTENIAIRNYYITKLQEILQSYSVEYGSQYHIFIYYPELDIYIESVVNDNVSDKDYLKFTRANIRSKLGENKSDNFLENLRWNFINNDYSENGYIIKTYTMTSMNTVIGCWINPNNIITPVKNVMNGSSYTICLYDQEEHVVTKTSGKLENKNTYQKKFSNFPFHISVSIHDYRIFNDLQKIYIILLLLSFAILIYVLENTFYLYKNVMEPLKHYSHDLDKVETMDFENLSSSNIIELDSINHEFKKLFIKIGNLQKEIYEAEINKQEITMDYLNIQIEPHFYLNCLNFIYNMIDAGEYTQAKKMSVFTSEYMRYLFRREENQVTIKEEMDHISHYLDIQKLRFKNSFSYYIDYDDDVMEEQIPPLTIQTFVENSMKYAMNFETCLIITITMYSEMLEGIRYYNICITDNGPGFTHEFIEDIADIEKFNRKQSDRNHIGISNVIQRLRMIYGNAAIIKIYNGPQHGAVVDLHIPCNIDKVKKDNNG